MSERGSTSRNRQGTLPVPPRTESQDAADPARYAVQHYTLCDGWVNTWTVSIGNNDSVPHVFATREEAQAELDEFLREIQNEIASGDRAPDEGYDASEFRIVAIREGGAS